MCSSVHFLVCFTKFIWDYEIKIVNLRHQILVSYGLVAVSICLSLSAPVFSTVSVLACIVDIAISEMNFHKNNRLNPNGMCIVRSRSFRPRSVLLFMLFLCLSHSSRMVEVDMIDARFGIFNCTSLKLCYIYINMACCGMKRPFPIRV